MKIEALLGTTTALGLIALAAGAEPDPVPWTANFSAFTERIGVCVRAMLPGKVSDTPRGFRLGPALAPGEWLLLSLNPAEAGGTIAAPILSGLQGERVRWDLIVDKIHDDPKGSDVAISFSTSNLLRVFPTNAHVLSFTAMVSPSERSTARELHIGHKVSISGTLTVGPGPEAQFVYGIGKHAGEIGVMIALEDASISERPQK